MDLIHGYLVQEATALLCHLCLRALFTFVVSNIMIGLYCLSHLCGFIGLKPRASTMKPSSLEKSN